MKVILAEYAVGVGEEKLLAEGRAMLFTLKASFERLGHEVVYPRGVSDFDGWVEKNAGDCDAALIIAPDELLFELTRIVESRTLNLGCPPHAVRKCADKLLTTEILKDAGVPVPRTLSIDDFSGVAESQLQERSRYVIKPRFGCAAEDTFLSVGTPLEIPEGKEFVATEFLDGEHISVSMISPDGVSCSFCAASPPLPLTINKQFIKMNSKISYEGGLVPYSVPERSIKNRVFGVAEEVVRILGCEGYVGIDIVLAESGKPYVVDVNPRPTTSIVGVARVINHEIADLILRAKLGGTLPRNVKVEGSFRFDKNSLERIAEF